MNDGTGARGERHELNEILRSTPGDDVDRGAGGDETTATILRRTIARALLRRDPHRTPTSAPPLPVPLTILQRETTRGRSRGGPSREERTDKASDAPHYTEHRRFHDAHDAVCGTVFARGCVRAPVISSVCLP